MESHFSDLTLGGSQQAGGASGSEHSCRQNLAVFGLRQLGVEGGLCSVQNPPVVKVDLPVPTAKKSHNLLSGNQLDLTDLLTVGGSDDDCRETRGQNFNNGNPQGSGTSCRNSSAIKLLLNSSTLMRRASCPTKTARFTCLNKYVHHETYTLILASSFQRVLPTKVIVNANCQNKEKVQN